MAEHDDPEEPGDSSRASHRETSARMRAIALLANRLVGLKPGVLASVPLTPELDEAVRACQGFTKNARARQLRRIGSLLRATDLAPIEAAMREIETGRGERSRHEQSYEHWHVRLLKEGDPAMTAFVRAHPSADVQALRQHVRMAVREPESPRGKGAARELLRAIRALGEATPVASEAQPASTASHDDDHDA